MKVYFSIWGYCDPTRVGYDTVGVTYYHTQKPSSFAGIGSTEVVEVEIPDTYSDEETRRIGKKAEQLMDQAKNYNPGWAVRKILAEMA